MTQTKLSRAFTLAVAVTCSGGCTLDMWNDVSSEQLIFPVVVGVDRPSPGDPRLARLIVQYRTYAGARDSNPKYAIALPIDGQNNPVPPFRDELVDGPSRPRPTSRPFALSAGDFELGRAARGSGTFIPAGRPGGAHNGGAEVDVAGVTRVNYYVELPDGRLSGEHWLRLPRQVARPDQPGAGQVALAVVLTPFTFTFDAITQPLGAILFPFAVSAGQ